MRLVIIVVVLGILSGCVIGPGLVNFYIRPEREGATYYKRSCAYGAPKSVAVIPFEGIYLSARVDQYLLSDRKERYFSRVQIGIHVPEGHIAQFESRSLRLTYDGGGEDAEIIPIAGYGGDHYIFSYPGDPYGHEDFFGSLRGASEKTTFKGRRYSVGTISSVAHKVYNFSAQSTTMSQLTSIQFPRLKIDGRSFDGPALTVAIRDWEWDRFEVFGFPC